MNRLHSVNIVVVLLLGTMSSVLANVDEANERNHKKGIAAHKVQSCAALEPHLSPSWWYSWSLTDGFGSTTTFSNDRGSFCSREDSARAVDGARRAGMDFVPMLGHTVPPRPFDAHVDANLRAAKYLLTFNEPEFARQANLDPAAAAEMWSEIVEIAEEYDVRLVGPCSESGRYGRTWYREWTKECRARYGEPCRYDFVCLHMYYHPYPCAPGVKDWACIGSDATKAANVLRLWHNEFGGKRIWVTEFACAPWGGAKCAEKEHADLMKQMGPMMEDSDLVYRYAWYELYNIDWRSNSLNNLLWHGSKGMGCPNKKWLSSWGAKDWQIRTMDECVVKARTNGECFTPLSLSMDDDACYCATDACDELVKKYPAMTTYQQRDSAVNARDEGGARLTKVGVEYDVIGASAKTDSWHTALHSLCSMWSPCVRFQTLMKAKRFIFS